MDSSDGASVPDGQIVNAWLPGADTAWPGVTGSDRGTAPGNVVLLAVGENEQPQGPHVGHMTYYRHAGRGFVFAAGSITFGGSLVVDVDLQQVVCNAIDEGLGWRDFQGTTYAGIWEQRGGPASVERHGLGPEEYQRLVEDLGADRRFGVPTTDELQSGQGRVSFFTDGVADKAIYWSPATPRTRSTA